MLLAEELQMLAIETNTNILARFEEDRAKSAVFNALTRFSMI